MFEICKKLEIHDNISNRNKLKEWAVKIKWRFLLLTYLQKIVMKRILNYVNNVEVQFHEVREPMTFVPIHAVLHI